MQHKGPIRQRAHSDPGDVSLALPKDKQLAELLRGSGLPSERMLNAMANVADPADRGSGVVTLPARPTAAGKTAYAGQIAEDIGVLLAKARRENHPAADALAEVGRQLGVADPGPVQAPEPGQVA
jgi:hypothetical protein